MVPRLFDYIASANLDARLDRLAAKIVESGIEPQIFIQGYLDHMSHQHDVLSEAFFGNFFRRLGNAWRAFWKKPDSETPDEYFDNAKEALNALVGLVRDNAKAGGYTLSTVLNGLEQSLNILTRVEQPLKQYSQQVMNYRTASQGGRAFVPSLQDAELPPDKQQRLNQILQSINQAMGLPESDEKINQVLARDQEFRQFIQQLEDEYQNPQTNATIRDQLGKFLRVLENDSAFREIKHLLDFARQRTAGQIAHRIKWPDQWRQVRQSYQMAAQRLPQENDRKNAVLQWYSSLPPTHPIKKFIQDELRTEGGGSEQELFWQYAEVWIFKNPSHIQGSAW